jgi:hypothetical protein
MARDDTTSPMRDVGTQRKHALLDDEQSRAGEVSRVSCTPGKMPPRTTASSSKTVSASCRAKLPNAALQTCSPIDTQPVPPFARKRISADLPRPAER